MAVDAAAVVALFNGLFAGTHNTILSGGAQEPFYRFNSAGTNIIFFREDYLSSALHEVAHWCIAGAQRRACDDYGYSYQANRDRAAQVTFENFETRPQALEWVFSVAAGCPFRVSQDNFNIEATRPDCFKNQVRAAVLGFVDYGLPHRANQFAQGLSDNSQARDFMQCHHYDKLPG